MKSLKIKKNKDDEIIPWVDFDAGSHTCKMGGESLPENTVAFYKPIINWVDRYTKSDREKIHFQFFLRYISTSSSKSILTILLLLKAFEQKGNKVIIEWHLEDGDMDVEEEIDDLSMETNLVINKVYF